MTVLITQALNVDIAGIAVTRDLDLRIEPGQFWALLGPNGVGKTTLLKVLAGLADPAAGSVRIAERDVRALPRRAVARQIGMLQQHTVYQFDCSVLETALTGRHPHLAYWEREGPDDRRRAIEALESVDLAGFANRSVTSLSGGEARRLALAALLVQQTPIMLLDEPTNHLDLRHQVQIMDRVFERTRKQVAALAALHDVNLASRWCSHVLMLFGDGRWAAGTRADMLQTERLEQLYACPVERLEAPDGPRFYPASPADC